MSQLPSDDIFEPTQLSQPTFSQTQNTQGCLNSQVEPRHKYWAIFISTHSDRDILKVPWSKPFVQLGRGPHALTRNDVILAEKRVSNIHCRFTLGIQSATGSELSAETTQAWKDGEREPEVWVEDLKSSNGTFVNGARVSVRRLLQHGDEISLGHPETLDYHDVRYIYRSIGSKGSRTDTSSHETLSKVGEVFERYQLLERLGKGTFAEVRKAVDVETGDMRAIKQIVKHRFAGNTKTLQLFHREINITRSLEHENICRLIDWYEDPQHICLVLEFVDGGDLLDYIMQWPNESGGGLPEKHAIELTIQICRAMAYTHSKGITHRDLKPENILLSKGDNGCPKIKVADFGLAKMIHTNTMLVSMVGTPQYLAPEVVMQTKQQPGYENVVDSWSVGIIVYSMMTKALPFDEDSEIPVDQRVRARFTQPADLLLLEQVGMSKNAIDFVARLLEKDPAKRLTMKQALRNQWLSDPTSQPTASQQVGLGGDSMWSIQSFDSPIPSDSYLEVESPFQWDRPTTASGTNLESGMGGSDDFSQPMTNLHLATPDPLDSQGGRDGKESGHLEAQDSQQRRPISLALLSPPPTAINGADDTFSVPTPSSANSTQSHQKRKFANNQEDGELNCNEAEQQGEVVLTKDQFLDSTSRLETKRDEEQKTVAERCHMLATNGRSPRVSRPRKSTRLV
ncbi:uncharacterized protein L203_101116 [Cryptococcus depauperatus CBS 7841]|uniref:Uncharacterized protein n=1 Tax=Cryptococcus depauperatus CBS 7841 TaxID=1295531 RepID=A0A1E3IMT4_9TREE|nr:CAMK protein kinase [Cryptococcus depauperatus CBS 7841]